MSIVDHNLHPCILAALILHDGGIPITGDKLKSLLNATNNTDVQLVYCNIVAKFLKDKDIAAMLTQLQPDASVGVGKQDADWDMVSDATTEVDVVDACESSDEDEVFCMLFD
jgi:ribosomal protein L12E/L44/L45/RPP1/RPP2